MAISDVPTQTLPDEGEIGFVDIGSLTTESGAVIDDVHIAVQRWGELSPTRDNVVMVLHALTGDSHITGPAGPGHPTGRLVGRDGRAGRSDRHQPLVRAWPPMCWAVAAAPPGPARGPGTESLGAQGSRASRFVTRSRRTSPRWPRWGSSGSPRWSVDPWAAQGLWSGSSATLTGSGPGCCWRSARAPPPIRSAPSAPRSPRSRPTRTGRAATTTTPGCAPDAGLAIARRFAHLTYRGEAELDDRFGNDGQGDEDPANGGRYAVQSYLEYQGDKLVDRFDAGSYVVLTEAMNSHDVGRGRGGVRKALRECPVPVVVGGITSDRLYPLRLQQELAELLPGCTDLQVVDSLYGHDGFLVESDAVGEMIRKTLVLADRATGKARRNA